MSKILLIIVWLLMAALSLEVAILIAIKKDKYNRSLFLLMIASAGVTLSYLASVLVESRQLMSFYSSIYFSFVDMVVIALFSYTMYFTRVKNEDLRRKLVSIAGIYAVFDITVLMINVVKEIALSYTYVENSLAHWRFVSYPLHYMHLGFCYILVAATLFLMLAKMQLTPAAYKGRYRIPIVTMLIVVGMNAVFLFVPKNNFFDFSVLFYGLAGYMFYWNQFEYSATGMLNETRKMLLDDLGHAIVLFDFDECFTLCNHEGRKLIAPENRTYRYSLDDFIRDWSFADFIEDKEEDLSFQWHTNRADISPIYRCDYKILRDKKNKILGRVFTFTDLSLNTDILTGFYTESSFRHSYETGEISFDRPTTVTVCDLNRLSAINQRFGRNAGDRAIYTLSSAMIRYCPSNAFFVRLQDANLMAICPGSDLLKMREVTDQIRNELKNCTDFVDPLELQYASSVISESQPDILVAMDSAIKSVRARKLMDPNSAHTSLLNSLAQTQLEGDNETEAHVRRTQIMGEKLGRRMGLSDIDLSNLSLLCLLHDIGKVGIPLEILNKPGHLNQDEWTAMRSHVERGYRIAMASDELKDIADLILHHHESWDGTGYPDQIEKEEIPLLSRVIAVVDTFDAMTNDRPYRKALPVKSAVEELIRCAGTQFDPYIVTEFIELLKEEYPDLTISAEAVAPSLSEKKKMPMGTILPGESLNPDAKLTYVNFCKYLLGKDYRIISVDDNFESFTGYSREDLDIYQLTQPDLIVPEEREEYLRLVENAPRQDVFIEHQLRKKDGTTRFVLCYGKPFFDSANRELRTEILVTDIAQSTFVQNMVAREHDTARRKYERQEDTLRQDPLTGILNRVAFQNDAQLKLLEGRQRIVMIMTDIDRFKQYNDSYGHWKGDQLLTLFAHTLQDKVQENGLASRMGGDEFAVLLYFTFEDTDSYMKSFIEDFWRSLSDELHAFDLNVTISMGAAAALNTATFNQLYKQADEALYKAKEAGRNQVFIANI